MQAMIVLKQTPRGMKLIPISELTGSRGLKLQGQHPLAPKAQEVMDYLMVHARPLVNRGQRPTLKALWDLVIAQYGETWFPDVKYLSPVGETPARLLIVEKKS